MNTPPACTSKRLLDCSTPGDRHAPSPQPNRHQRGLGTMSTPCSRKSSVRPQQKKQTTPHSLTHNTHPIHSFNINARLSLVLLVIATLFFGGVSARSHVYAGKRYDALVIDRSPNPARAAHLMARSAATATDDLPSSIVAPTASLTASTTARSTTSTTATSGSKASATATSDIATDANSSSSGSDSMPVPFDGAALSANLTADCSNFLKSTLADEGFRNCLPLSMLLQNSDSFFKVLSKSALTISKVIDKTCNVDVKTCTTMMDGFSGSITADSNCAKDYAAGNPIVTQVFSGLVAYLPQYEAGCLKSDAGNYCYVEAITDIDSPGNGAVYFLPLGTQLSSKPSCTKCLVQTMAKFAVEATNSTQPLSVSYNSAASMINTECGDSTVKAGLEVSNSADSTARPVYMTAIVTAATLAILIL